MRVITNYLFFYKKDIVHCSFFVYSYFRVICFICFSSSNPLLERVPVKFGRYVVVFLFVMALLIVFGNNGVIDNLIMKEKQKILKNTNAQLAFDNSQLKREIILLRNNPQYIESLARNELGMVRKGELVYKFSD